MIIKMIVVRNSNLVVTLENEDRFAFVEICNRRDKSERRTAQGTAFLF